MQSSKKQTSWTPQYTRSIFQGLCILVACLLAGIPAKTVAQARPTHGEVSSPSLLVQAIPDGTLPTSVEQLQEIMKINGGERAGNNLFHSFEEFSIPDTTWKVSLKSLYNKDFVGRT